MSAGGSGGTSAPGSAATQQRIRASSVQLKRINSKQFISTK